MFLFSKKFRHSRFYLFDFSRVKLPAIPTLAIAVLCFLSLLTLYSAAGGSLYPWAIKQSMFFVCFFIVALLVAALNSDTLYKLAPLSLILCILGLFAVVLFGKVSMGAKRWIDLKFVKIQPSEATKIGIILTLSYVFSKLPPVRRIFDPFLILIAAIILVPFGLVVMQPDLATAMICLLLSGAICFLCGVRMEIFISIFLSILIAIPIIWSSMHDYQRKRITTFLRPSEVDQLGSGYSVVQSKIAIGSGGIFGTGLVKGAQSQLNFLPENQTDFIFAMLGEEMGFFGCMLVIACYVVIILYGMDTAKRARSIFNKAIASGASLMFFFHAAINAGMTSGLLPVAGIPMPLLSYGGSSVAISMICFGLMLNVDINRFVDNDI